MTPKELRPYTIDDLVQDLVGERLGPCVICGLAVTNRRRDGDNNFQFVCSYDKDDCMRLWHINRFDEKPAHKLKGRKP